MAVGEQKTGGAQPEKIKLHSGDDSLQSRGVFSCPSFGLVFDGVEKGVKRWLCSVEDASIHVLPDRQRGERYEGGESFAHGG